MKKIFDDKIKTFYDERVLVLFGFSTGNVVWRGESVLDTETLLYYFSIEGIEYILVNETHTDGGEYLANELIGNAVAPHQRLVRIRPKEGSRSYVRILGEVGKTDPYVTGYFSVFRIIS